MNHRPPLEIIRSRLSLITNGMLAAPACGGSICAPAHCSRDSRNAGRGRGQSRAGARGTHPHACRERTRIPQKPSGAFGRRATGHENTDNLPALQRRIDALPAIKGSVEPGQLSWRRRQNFRQQWLQVGADLSDSKSTLENRTTSLQKERDRLRELNEESTLALQTAQRRIDPDSANRQGA